jgi:HSP20 family protein
MDRAFGDALSRPDLFEVPNLALDMYETDTDVVVKTALPGVTPDDVEVSVLGDTLTIRGERKGTGAGRRKAPVHHRESSYGRFFRAVTLPALVKAEEAKAEFENGVLTLTLPKAEEAKPKSIKVQAH